MSLINQMLRDLENRPEDGDRETRVRAVDGGARRWGWALAVLLLAGVGVVWLAWSFMTSGPVTMDDPAGPGLEPMVTLPDPAAEAEASPEPPVRLQSIEQVRTRDGVVLRLDFDGDSDYRRRPGPQEGLVIEARGELADDLRDTLPPAVAGLERRPLDEGYQRLALTLSDWESGTLTAERRDDGGDRLQLTLRPVAPPSAATAPEKRVAEDEPAGEEGASESEATGEDGRGEDPSTDAVAVDETDVSAEEPAEESEADAESAMRRERREPSDAERAARAWEAAQDALRDGATAAVEPALRQVLSWQPEHVAAREALMELVLEEGRVHDADRLLAEADTVSGLVPADRNYFLRQRARLWMGQEDLDRAIEVIEDAQTTAEPETRALLAGLLYRDGRYQAAVDAYEALLDEPPRESAWWMGLGLAREGLSEWDGAVAAYRRALEGDGLRPSVRDYLTERIRELGGDD